MNDLQSRAEATARLLHAAVRESGAWISGDLRVSEATAAELLGFAPGTLANQRSEGRSPPFFRVAGRPTYRLHDLATFIEASRQDW